MDKLFESYAAAFLSLDPVNVSGFYAFPVTFYTETGAVVTLEDDAFLENSKKLFAIYSELDVADIEFQILTQESVNNSFRSVSVSWSFISSIGTEIYSAITRYLVQTDNMKIVSVITVDEMSKINKVRKQSL